MAEELPAGTPEVDDPLLVADLLKLLKVKGAIGRMQLADIVLPVVSLGDVVTPSIEIRQPSFRSTDVFSAGAQTGPLAGTVLADTGPLPQGIYDIALQMSTNEGSSANTFALQHRDAPNTANLMESPYVAGVTNFAGPIIWAFPFAYEFGANERLRVVNVLVGTAGLRYMAVIFARLRG